MTKYALIKQLENSILKIVKTRDIADFDDYLDNPDSTDIYLSCVGECRATCLIMAVGGSIEELNHLRDKNANLTTGNNKPNALDDMMKTQDCAEKFEIEDTLSIGGKGSGGIGSDDGIKKSSVTNEKPRDHIDAESSDNDSETEGINRTTKDKKRVVQRRKNRIDAVSSDNDSELEEKKRIAKNRKRQIEKKECTIKETADQIVQAYKKSRLNASVGDGLSPSKKNETNLWDEGDGMGGFEAIKIPNCQSTADNHKFKSKVARKCGYETREDRSLWNQPGPSGCKNIHQGKKVDERTPNLRSSNNCSDSDFADSPPNSPFNSPQGFSTPVSPTRMKGNVVRNLFYKQKNQQGETAKNNMCDLGDGIWIKEESYEKAKRVNHPSKFVTTLAYSIWGYEALANRCVRQIKGKAKMPELTPKKVVIISKKFENYLKNRKCDKLTFFTEMNKLNSYLGRAIGGAKKHIATRNQQD